MRVDRARPASAGLLVVPPFAIWPGAAAADALAWILLLLVARLGIIVAGWLWSKWIRLRPPTAPGLSAPSPREKLGTGRGTPPGLGGVRA